MPERHTNGSRTFNTALVGVACVVLTLAVVVAASERAPAERKGRHSAPGLLTHGGANPIWPMRQGGKHVFISGPGDPEDFLYRGVRKPDGTRDGDQEELIYKLVRHGGNCVYVQAIRSHGGDGKPDHNPFVGSDPALDLDEPILDQWERWFDLMDRNGIVVVLFVYDDSARVWNTGDRVGADERRFIEHLVRRFRHHNHLIWVVAEEAEEALPTERSQAIAAIIAAADRPGRIVANHHHSGTEFKSYRPDGPLSLFAMQLNVPLDEVHRRAREAYKRAAGRYGILYAENTDMEGADTEGARRFIWGAAMAGTMPMLFGCDRASTPPETLRLFRIQQRFFEATDFQTMAPHDELATEASTWVLANPGRSYIVYSDKAAGLMAIRDAPRGTYDADWTDTVTGTRVAGRRLSHTGGTLRLTRPEGIGASGAVWVRRVGPVETSLGSSATTKRHCACACQMTERAAR